MRGAFSGARPASGAPFPPYRGFVVADYFARGRKRFSALPKEAFAGPFAGYQMAAQRQHGPGRRNEAT